MADDDNLPKLEGARAAGFEAVLVDGPDAARDALVAAGVIEVD